VRGARGGGNVGGDLKTDGKKKAKRRGGGKNRGANGREWEGRVKLLGRSEKKAEETSMHRVQAGRKGRINNRKKRNKTKALGGGGRSTGVKY